MLQVLEADRGGGKGTSLRQFPGILQWMVAPDLQLGGVQGMRGRHPGSNPETEQGAPAIMQEPPTKVAQDEQGGEILGFGKWKGVRMADTPQEYQEWASNLCTSSNPQMNPFRDWSRGTVEAQQKLNFGHHPETRYKDTSADLRHWARTLSRPENNSVTRYQRRVMKQEWTHDQGPEWDLHQRAYQELPVAAQQCEWEKAWRYLDVICNRRSPLGAREGWAQPPPRKRGRVALVAENDETGQTTLRQQWVPGVN